MRWSWQPISCLAVCLALLGCRSRDDVQALPLEPGQTPPGQIPPGPPPYQSPAGWKEHAIGKSAIKMLAPPDYVKTDEPNETLVLTLPSDPTIKLRFNDQAYLKVPNINGESFVKAQAKAKKLPISEIRGKFVVTEKKTSNSKGAKVFVQYWFIGWADQLAVVTATMFDDKKALPEVKECLEKTIPQIIESMQK